jgi:Ulp1 family protease
MTYRIVDSIKHSNESARACAQMLDRFLLEHAAKQNKVPWQLQWEVVSAPRQNNTVDCGLCVCVNMALFAAGKPLNYEFDAKQKVSGTLRRKVAVELVTGKLI